MFSVFRSTATGTMLAARRVVPETVHRLRVRSQRRLESSHGPDSYHHTEPTTENLGPNFFLTLAALPLGYAIYVTTKGTEDKPSAFTRLIQRYSDYKDEWVRRNSLHTKMVEQAAFDRNLFESERAPKTVTLPNPEVFNNYSPYAHHAGHQADLTELVKHIEAENKKVDEDIAKRQYSRKP